MTRMLASVANRQEAWTLMSIGVDILDIKEPRLGALGAVDTQTVQEIVNLVAGRIPTSATIGDIPMQTGLIDAGITRMRSAAVDIIKVGVFAETITTGVLHVLQQHARSGARIVLVYFADKQPALIDFPRLVDTGVYGVMLDTADKSSGSLRSIVQEEVLQTFVAAARASGLITGLAGSLQAGDITPLLLLEPDYLGFRSALCRQGQRQMAVDIHAAQRVRNLIPNNYPSLFKGEGKGWDEMVKFAPPSLPSP